MGDFERPPHATDRDRVEFWAGGRGGEKLFLFKKVTGACGFANIEQSEKEMCVWYNSGQDGGKRRNRTETQCFSPVAYSNGVLSSSFCSQLSGLISFLGFFKSFACPAILQPPSREPQPLRLAPHSSLHASL